MSMKIRIDGLPKNLPPNAGTGIDYSCGNPRLEKDKRGQLTLVLDYEGLNTEKAREELEKNTRPRTQEELEKDG